MGVAARQIAEMWIRNKEAPDVHPGLRHLQMTAMFQATIFDSLTRSISAPTAANFCSIFS
jgi:hypothetical protein